MSLAKMVLIKCPHSAFKMDVNEAIDKRKITFWSTSRKKKGSENTPRQVTGISKKHDWYYEAQATLDIMQRKSCLFTVWSGHEETSKCIKYEYIYPDEAFWTKEMDRKICTFYYDHLLPKSKDKQKTDSVPEEQRYHNYSVRLNNVIDITAAYLLLFRLPASDCDAIHPVGGN